MLEPYEISISDRNGTSLLMGCPHIEVSNQPEIVVILMAVGGHLKRQ